MQNYVEPSAGGRFELYIVIFTFEILTFNFLERLVAIYARLHRHEIAEVGLFDRSERGAFFIEKKVDFAGWPVAMFLDKYLGNIGFLCATVGIHFVLAVNKHDHVRVLLDRSRIAEV